MNTAFCVLSPDGEERLTRSGRAPNHGIRHHDLAAGMKEIAARYRAKGATQSALVPSHPSLRMAQNLAAADEQLLVVVSAPKNELDAARNRLRALANDDEVIGRFHYFFEESEKKEIRLLQPDPFGQKSKVLKALPLGESMLQVKKEFLALNRDYAEKYQRKSYREHIQEGRSRGISWEMPMEFGEDRDGDGEIDHRGGHGTHDRRHRRRHGR